MAETFLSRFVDNVAMVAADHAGWLSNCADMLAALEHSSEMLSIGADSLASDDSFWPAADSWQARYRPYNVQSGVLTIPVTGVLLNNFSFGTEYATGYQYLDRAWERGMGDKDVAAIHLAISSGGGDAAGNFDLVDKMTATKTKPVLATAEPAYSAAYNIATAANKISVSRTGGVGSIGVVTGHMDQSAALDKAGLKMTFISAPEGGDKTEGNSFEKLSGAARERMQERVDELYQHFVDSVSRNRGMDEQAIRATKARTFTAAKALSNGLADTKGSPSGAMANFLADLSSNDGDLKMSTPNAGTVDQATHDAAIAAARTEGHAAGLTAGAAAERTRIDAILASDVAKDRPALAAKIAFKQSMSADDAISFMADLPAEAKAAAPEIVESASAHANDKFKEAMDKTGGAGVVPAGDKTQVADPDDAAPALAAAASFGIAGLKSTKKLAEARGN